MSAIQELIEAVEGGVWWRTDSIWLWGEENHQRAVAAYTGSSDAARALHEAVLPGWPMWLSIVNGRSIARIADRFSAEADNPARAWLLAILKALATTTEGQV
jgi:hypothetical protein